MKIDLHTHSIASPDGSITEDQYRHMLESGGLDCVAITDHDRIDFALSLRQKLGDKIIVGEEITTQSGDIVGLFLLHTIPAGLSLEEAVKAIKSQGGLVYVPHPFETVRKGISLESLQSIATQVDIIEGYNGRAVFQQKGGQAETWAIEHGLPRAAASDAHGFRGWGKTYTVIDRPPTVSNLPELLRKAAQVTGPAGLLGVLYPKFNRLRKVLR